MAAALFGDGRDQQPALIGLQSELRTQCGAFEALGPETQVREAVKAAVLHIVEEVAHDGCGHDVADVLGLFESRNRNADELAIGDGGPSTVARVDGGVDLYEEQARI